MRYRIITIAIFIFLFYGIKAQSNAVNGAKTVDHFTGAFTYAVPLITLPSSKGPSVNISTSYRSGIKTNQQSSMVGLGWNISFGEITRQVNGFPDDYKGDEVDVNKFYPPKYR